MKFLKRTFPLFSSDREKENWIENMIADISRIDSGRILTDKNAHFTQENSEGDDPVVILSVIVDFLKQLKTDGVDVDDWPEVEYFVKKKYYEVVTDDMSPLANLVNTYSETDLIKLFFNGFLILRSRRMQRQFRRYLIRLDHTSHKPPLITRR